MYMHAYRYAARPVRGHVWVWGRLLSRRERPSRTEDCQEVGPAGTSHEARAIFFSLLVITRDTRERKPCREKRCSSDNTKAIGNFLLMIFRSWSFLGKKKNGNLLPILGIHILLLHNHTWRPQPVPASSFKPVLGRSSNINYCRSFIIKSLDHFLFHKKSDRFHGRNIEKRFPRSRMVVPSLLQHWILSDKRIIFFSYNKSSCSVTNSISQILAKLKKPVKSLFSFKNKPRSNLTAYIWSTKCKHKKKLIL
jgi:hypothetical protein